MVEHFFISQEMHTREFEENRPDGQLIVHKLI